MGVPILHPNMKVLLVLALLVALVVSVPLEPVEPEPYCGLIQAADCFGDILEAAAECVSFKPEDWMQCMLDILISVGKEQCKDCICDLDIIDMIPDGVCP